MTTKFLNERVGLRNLVNNADRVTRLGKEKKVSELSL